MHLEYEPSKSVSHLVKKQKRRSSRKLQQEFPELKHKYFGHTFLWYWLWMLEYRKLLMRHILRVLQLNNNFKFC